MIEFLLNINYMEGMNHEEKTFQITDAAKARIAKILSDEPEGTAFVVEVLGGGCSGFQYHFALKKPELGEGDFIVNDHGAFLVVDSISLDMLKESKLDYKEDLAQAGFEISNPQATASCGCGNSFNVM